MTTKPSVPPRLISADDLRMAAALQRLQALSGRLNEEGAESLARLRRLLLGGQGAEADRLYGQIQEKLRLSQELQAITDSIPENGAVHDTFLVSALLLREAYRLCTTQDGHENIVYVGGTRYQRYLLAEHLKPVKLASASRTHAASDPRDTARIMQEFEECGAVLVLYFHRHPGSGAGANIPSVTDLHNQETMERGGLPAIGGIFSNDGLLRYFSKDVPFTIRLSGKGVTHAGTNLYQLHNI